MFYKILKRLRPNKPNGILLLDVAYYDVSKMNFFRGSTSSYKFVQVNLLLLLFYIVMSARIFFFLLQIIQLCIRYKIYNMVKYDSDKTLSNKLKKKKL